MIDSGSHMIAPCGMNCSYCYVHHKKKSRCPGCRIIDGNQPKSCRNCKIKNCILSRKIDFCNQCNDFPCIQLKRLDKSYRTRYKESLIESLNIIEQSGMENFILNQKEKYKCLKCGSSINMHDRKCYECDS